MKILLIGLGSIGKRHLTNLLHLGFSDVTVVSRSAALPAEFSALTSFRTLDAALAAGTYHAAVICTPTSLHVPSLLALLQARVPNIYVEKPVSHSMAGLAQVSELAASYSCNLVVGFDMHFDPGLMKVKELVNDKNTIGDIVSLNAAVGQYLPDWRPAEDYRLGMSAKQETGGGVMLDLVHEFDYVSWICGPVQKLACFYKNSGALQIETEDIAEVIVSFQNGALGSIHLDYLQPQLVRNCLITGSRGSITWNLATSSVNWIGADKQTHTFDYTGFQRNQRFVNIMSAFLNNVPDERLTSLQQGIESLKLVLAAKLSAEEQRFVTPGEVISPDNI